MNLYFEKVAGMLFGKNSKISEPSIDNTLLLSSKFLFFCICAFFCVVLLVGSYLLYYSHRYSCELFESRLFPVAPNVSSEIALGEVELARRIFYSAIAPLEKLNAKVSVALQVRPHTTIVNECNPSIFKAEISKPLYFAGNLVGSISGEITAFNYTFVIIFVLLNFLVACSFYRLTKFRFIEAVRSKVLLPIESLNSEDLFQEEELPLEIRIIAKKLKTIKDAIIVAEVAKNELSKAEYLSKVTSQVAHDIRSPLEVLKSLRDELSSLPLNVRDRLSLSISRIEEIALQLLKDNRKDGFAPQKSVHLLSALIDVVAEKRIEFRKFPDFSIEENFNSGAYNIWSNIDASRFKSIASNIINNSFDGCPGGIGKVSLSLKYNDQGIEVSFSDNGKGIEPEILSKLFNGGITTKIDGNGIGLVSAKEYLQSIGGSIEIDSLVAKGTTVIVKLPIVSTPTIFPVSIPGNYDKIIILDDDPSFHELWIKKFSSLQSIVHYYSPKELFANHNFIPENTLFICDYDLSDNDTNGLKVIQQIGPSTNTILVSARNMDGELRILLEHLGIKFLPKCLVHYVPFTDINSETTIVLIDDDKLVRLNWSLYCSERKFVFYEFPDVDTFMKSCSAISYESYIFVDSSLGNNIKGEVEAEKIYLAGFNKIYLSTGYDPQMIALPEWIHKQVSKSPKEIDRIRTLSLAEIK